MKKMSSIVKKILAGESVRKSIMTENTSNHLFGRTKIKDIEMKDIKKGDLVVYNSFYAPGDLNHTILFLINKDPKVVGNELEVSGRLLDASFGEDIDEDPDDFAKYLDDVGTIGKITTGYFMPDETAVLVDGDKTPRKYKYTKKKLPETITASIDILGKTSGNIRKDIWVDGPLEYVTKIRTLLIPVLDRIKSNKPLDILSGLKKASFDANLGDAGTEKEYVYVTFKTSDLK